MSCTRCSERGLHWLVHCDSRRCRFADTDGVLFAPYDRVEDILSIARSIAGTERQQAQDIQAGKRLREQLRFDEYLARRTGDPSYTFRQHLRGMRGAIEE